MANNLFLDRNQFTPTLKRNAYDLFHLVNGTWQSGIIYPIDWQEVTFGDGMRTKIRAAIRTMPMVWPIQTPIIAKFYQFYVRYRTICPDFMDFRFGNKPLVSPYLNLDSDSDFWKTGELFDWLDGPTTYASDHIMWPYPLVAPKIDDVTPKSFPVAASTYSFSSTIGHDFYSFCNYSQEGSYIRFFGNISKKLAMSNHLVLSPLMINGSAVSDTLLIFVLDHRIRPGVESNQLVAFVRFDGISSLKDDSGYYQLPLASGTVTYYTSGSPQTLSGGLRKFFDEILHYDNIESYSLGIAEHSAATDHLLTDTNFTTNQFDINSIDGGAGIAQLREVRNPFVGVPPEIPLSAFAPRAYEAIYNSHFRDPINEPFIVDGEVQYNRYVTNNGMGADSTDYKLKRRNWEADAFTSAKPSPQQGMAPIVGITSSGDITLQRLDGGEYTVRVTTDENGIIDGTQVTMPDQKSDHTIRRTLLDLATSGFTIESLRNVNAYQKFKEAVYRRTPRYKDQALSVFGVNLKYDELDMPEFLGGFSIPLNVNIINQTSSSVEGSPLGEIAGNGGFYGESRHTFQRYCDEEGIVMTLMCITPIPVYSQMLSRKWIRNTPLDFYNPQFGKIGNQPITYEEVCPVQAYNEGVDVHDVFGYQRPWYHMTSAYDTVHGKMRDTMNGFVMQRIFGSTPELGASFLHIDESQLNDVFVVQDGEQDTFYGQVAVDQKVKKPIPRSNVPSLVG